jgi:uncharacterized protein YyaL (SSP411 family)
LAVLAQATDYAFLIYGLISLYQATFIRFAGFTDGLEVIKGETTAQLCRDGSSSDMNAVINQILQKR